MKKKFDWGLWIFLNFLQPVLWYGCYLLIFDPTQPPGSPFFGVVGLFFGIVFMVGSAADVANPDEAVKRVFEDYRRWRG